MARGKPVVVGVVGSSAAARFHTRNYSRIYDLDVRVKGVASRTPESARQFAEVHGLQVAYPSLEAMLDDPEINLVDLCVPNSLHRPLVVRCAEAGKHMVIEKPLTGYFGPGEADWVADGFSREAMLAGALRNADEMIAAVRQGGVKLCYAENWVYAPPIARAVDLMSKADHTVLRILAEQSHSGTNSDYNMRWVTAGGGSLFTKGCHPLSATLYIKRAEGLRKYGRPIRPRSVIADVKNLSRIESFLQEEPRWIRQGWVDCEDWGMMLLTFEDGSVAQITAGDNTIGGVVNTLSIYSTKLVIHCNINPNTSLQTFAPRADVWGDVQLREKAETNAGWQFSNPDEEWMTGYAQELQDFCEAVALDREPLCGPDLARDTILVGYAAYLAADEGTRIDLAPWIAYPVS